MKRHLTMLAVALCCAVTAAAQDTIFKTDAQTISAKILEISPSEVRYKRFTNPDGPTYILPVSDISHIIYQNGERDDFNVRQPSAQPSVEPEVCPEPTSEPQAAPAPVQQPEPQPAPAPVQQPASAAAGEAGADIRTRPEVGRVYDDNGVKGMVIWLDESGLHGLMLSLEESSDPRFMPWTTIRSPYPDTGATDKNDGRENMAAVERYIAANGASWDDFPAFRWCRELGEGWYLPSIDELLKLGYAFNGGQRMRFDRRARQKFNNMLKENGGTKVDPMTNYYSSTYWGDGQAATSTMEIEPPYMQPYKAHERYLVRAVRRF